ncbi:MAG: hypothetical protein HOW97_03185 [Catenulispora sp.]|nr:hypothetical protein [Catenulispora sp.]NUR57236.1 hypothetical protein [Catenulispora sp.]
MEITVASAAAPGGINEDYIITGQDFVVVLDGVTPLPNADYGCHHGVPWLVRRLGGRLAAGLTEPDIPLTELLCVAIADAMTGHEHTCDLANPYSPSTTVSILRFGPDSFDYLALADSPIVLQHHGTDPEVITGYTRPGDATPDHQRWPLGRHPEHPYTVAGIHPEAADKAVTGRGDLDKLRRAAVMTDGLSRLVDRHGLYAWAGLLDLLEADGRREPLLLCARQTPPCQPERFAASPMTTPRRPCAFRRRGVPGRRSAGPAGRP